MNSLFQKKRNVALIAVFYTFLWGLCFPLVKLCMSEFGVEDSNYSKCLVAGIRFIVSGLGLCLCLYFFREKSALPSKKALPYLLGYGLLATSLQYAFTYIGLSHVDGAKGAIFDQLCVFIIIILSGLLLRGDHLSSAKIIGAAVGFLGILAVSTGKMSFSFTASGEGMMVLAALCQVGAYFIAAVSAHRVKAIALVGYGQLFGGIALSVFAFLAGGSIPNISVLGILILLLLSIISALAYVLSLIPLKYFPASEISVFNLLITVFGVSMSAVVLGENVFRINYLISLLLISLGIILVNITGKDRTDHDRKNL